MMVFVYGEVFFCSGCFNSWCGNEAVECMAAAVLYTMIMNFDKAVVALQTEKINAVYWASCYSSHEQQGNMCCTRISQFCTYAAYTVCVGTITIGTAQLTSTRRIMNGRVFIRNQHLQSTNRWPTNWTNRSAPPFAFVQRIIFKSLISVPIISPGDWKDCARNLQCYWKSVTLSHASLRHMHVHLNPPTAAH